MNQNSGSNHSLVLSYLGLRKSVGIIGTALPFVLALGYMLLDGPGIQSSISSYYYTVMGDVLVGSMFAIAVFLMSYRGYERKDDVAGDLACLFAIGIAMFPTTPDVDPSSTQKIIGILHFVFAASFFLTLAYFCLALFRKKAPNKDPTPQKLKRNRVYTLCGYTILVCLALIILIAFVVNNNTLAKLDPIFWLESLAIIAFGISWLTKGEAILKDSES